MASKIFSRLLAFLMVITLYGGLFFSLQAQPKNRANQWAFGIGAGLDFGNSTGQPTALTNTGINAEEGCASVCDTNGQLLFYTDGYSRIWNRNHQVMPNGGNMAGWFSVAQSALIVPMPGSDHLYFVFNNAYQTQQYRNLRFSVVDMNLQGGLGDVTQKNISLLPATQEGMCAVMHANGRDVWLLVRLMEQNSFYAYLITATGISNPVISTFGQVSQITNIAMLKASPDGALVAHATHLAGWLDFYKFNNQTGQLTDPIFFNLSTIPDFLKRPYGITFSPNGKKFYFQAHGSTFTTDDINTTYTELYQLDVSNYASYSILNSQQLIAGINMDKINQGPRFMMQTGPDGKIYTARENDNWLGAILCPNATGAACNFVPKYVNLGTGTSQMGLPNYIEDWFYNTGKPRVHLLAGDFCAGQPVTLAVAGYGDTFSWQPDTLFDHPDSATVQGIFSQPTNVTVAVSGACFADTLQTTVAPLPQPATGLAHPHIVRLCSNQKFKLPFTPLSQNTYQYAYNPSRFDTTNGIFTYAYQNQTSNPDTAYWHVTATSKQTGCTRTDTLTIITQNQLAKASADTTICPGDTIMLRTDSAAGYSYAWAGPNITQPNRANTYAVPQQRQPDTLLLNYLLTTTYGNCIATDTLQATLLPYPLTNITGPRFVCPGDTQVPYYHTLSATDSFVWNYNGNAQLQNTLATDTLKFNFGNAPDSTQLWLMATSPAGCRSDTVFANIKVNQQLQPTIANLPDTICLPGNNLLTYMVQNANPNSNYNWHVTGGAFTTDSTNSVVTVAWDTTQPLGYLQITESTNTPNTYCTGQSTPQPVRWFQKPTLAPALLGDTAVCHLPDTSLIAVDPQAGTRFVWWVSPTARTFGNTNTAINVIITQAGQYQVYVQQRNQYGCLSPISSLPIKASLPPQPTITQADTLVCLPNLLGNYAAQSQDTNSTITWQVQHGIVDTNPINSKLITAQFDPPIWPTDTLAIRAIETLPNTCQAATPWVYVTADTNHPKIKYVTFDTAHLHPHHTASVYGLWQYQNPYATNPLGNALYNFGNTNANVALGTFTPTDTLRIANAQNPPYRLWLQVTNSCNHTLNTQVHQTIPLQGSATPDSNGVQLNWLPYQGWGNIAQTYQIWRRTDGQPWQQIAQTNANASLIPDAKAGFKHEYKVMAQHPNGQFFSFSNSVFVNFTHPLTIPNIVTPNGDGLNDTWRIENLNIYPDYQLKIYNRWGKPVLSTKRYQNNWNGTGTGGVFFYWLNEKQYGHTYKGWLQVIE